MTGILWPRDQLFLTDDALARLRNQSRDSFAAPCRPLQIAQDFTPLLDALYLPLAAWLHSRRKEQQQTLVVGLCGAQGSGKSTVGALLKLVLEEGFAQRVVAFSLDDLYKSR